jgi:hypothetical protein
MTDKIKRGDLLPTWSATLLDGVTPIDLTTATTVRVLGVMNGTLLIDREATSTNSVGRVTMDWIAGDTDLAGTIYFEVEVTWTGGGIQTFPAQGQIPTYVYADNG